jgi:hypothetical protein
MEPDVIIPLATSFSRIGCLLNGMDIATVIKNASMGTKLRQIRGMGLMLKRNLFVEFIKIARIVIVQMFQPQAKFLFSKTILRPDYLIPFKNL